MNECPCGQPLFDYMVVCSSCGADNPGYERMGWGRRVVQVFIAVLLFGIARTVLLEYWDIDLDFRQSRLLETVVFAGSFPLVAGLYRGWDHLCAWRVRARIHRDS